MQKPNFTIYESGIIKSCDGDVLAFYDRKAKLLHVNCDRRIYECGSDEIVGDALEIILQANGEAA